MGNKLAVVAEWSKMPVFSNSGHLGPRFESHSGYDIVCSEFVAIQIAGRGVEMLMI